MKTIILDFVGVVADLDWKGLVKNLSLKQKVGAIRIYVAMKKNKNFYELFNEYQKGLIDSETLQMLIAKFYPNSAKVLPQVLENLSKSIDVNNQVLEYVKAIKEKGAQVLLMSNSTPETEKVMNELNLSNLFDGIILSTEVGSIKPQQEIFDYAIKKYHIQPANTIMIDDTKKNLFKAEEFGIEAFQCKTSYETCSLLETYLSYLDFVYETAIQCPCD